MKFSLKEKYIFLLILIAAFALRVWGIGFGLPELFHQDEPIVVNHAMAYGTGDLNPHFFAIPPLTSYILFIVYGIMFLAGKLSGIWATSADFALSFFRDPSLFYVVGRIFIGLIPGMGCVTATILFSSRFLSVKAALYAGSVMAFSYLNVVNSHYIYTDMLLVLAVLLAYNSIFTLYRKGALKSYILSGILMGIAVGVKYNAGIIVVPFLLAHLLRDPGKPFSIRRLVFSGKLWSASLAAIVSFVVVNPFFILDWPGFWSSFSKQSNAFWHIGWRHHLSYSLFEGISMAVSIFGILGLLIFAKKDKWGVILLSFPLVLYFILAYKSQPFARYVLPLVPFISIGAGYFLFDMFSWDSPKRRMRQGILVIAIAMLIPGLVKSVKADILFSSTDTRIEAAKWIKDNLPRGTAIACDSTNFRPAIKQPYSQLLDKERFLLAQRGLSGTKKKKLNMMKEVTDKRDEGYPIFFLSESPEDQGQFLGTTPALEYDINVIKDKGIKYVSTNNQISNQAKRDFMPGFLSQSELVAEFTPYSDGEAKKTSDRTATTCLPVTGRELSSRDKTGPVLRIYRLK